MIAGQKLTEESATQKLPLGLRYLEETTGRVYYYVKANEALDLGAILTPMVAELDGDCDASTGTAFVDAADTLTAAMVGSFIKINAGTKSINQAPNEIVKFTDADNVVVKTAWSAALTTAEDYVIFHPWKVEECDAAGEAIVGVAPFAVTSGYYFWMQSGGYTEHVLVAGDTDAVVAHEGLVSSAAAGVAKGLTAAGTTVDEAQKSNITALVPTALAAQTLPAILSCLP
jgi:hypothetical protein